MFQNFEKALVQNKIHVPPSIYIKSDVDKNLATKLKEIIRKRNGQAVDNEESATHILYPHCDPLEEEYARPGMVVVEFFLYCASQCLPVNFIYVVTGRHSPVFKPVPSYFRYFFIFNNPHLLLTQKQSLHRSQVRSATKWL